MNYKHNIETCSYNHCCHRKQEVLHILSAWLVTLVIQHVRYMYCIILSSATCLAIPYFPTLSPNGMIFYGVWEHPTSLLAAFCSAPHNTNTRSSAGPFSAPSSINHRSFRPIIGQLILTNHRTAYSD
jgi:hypothetical protein